MSSRNIQFVTVLMTTYNDAAFIAFAIKSILNQSFKEFEFLIIDDGSTDNTESVVRAFRDSRIQYIKTEHIGRSMALNLGLKLSNYEWVALIDADDISHPDRLLHQTKFLNSNPETDILSSWYAVHDLKRILYPIKTLTNHNDIKRRLLLSSEIVHSGVIYRKNKVIEIGGYRETVFEDYDLWLRLSGTAVFRNVPEILLFIFVRSDSRSRKNIRLRYQDHYETMNRIYTDSGLKQFDLNAKSEIMIYNGWREYFYGDKQKARRIWKSLGFDLFTNTKIVSAWFVTFLPDSWFVAFKEFRWRFRLNYILTYFSKSNRIIRRDFSKLKTM